MKLILVLQLLLIFSSCAMHQPIYHPPLDPFEELNPDYQAAYKVVYPIVSEFGATSNYSVWTDDNGYGAAMETVHKLNDKGHLPSGYLIGLAWTCVYEGIKRSEKINKNHKSAWNKSAKRIGKTPESFSNLIKTQNKEGIEILKLVASYGYIPAQERLHALKQPVPSKQFKTPVEMEAENNYLYALIESQNQQQAMSSALIAGFSGIANSGSGTGMNPVGASQNVLIESNSCQFDTQCGVGKKCIKNSFDIKGFCAKLTDGLGIPSYDKNALPQECTSNLDCGLGFKCQKNSSFSGFCVR